MTVARGGLGFLWFRVLQLRVNGAAGDRTSTLLAFHDPRRRKRQFLRFTSLMEQCRVAIDRPSHYRVFRIDSIAGMRSNAQC